jgi:hypothetical protein
MPDPVTFDARLEAAVHAFADRAVTSVDAAAVAAHAARTRRHGPLAWLGVSVPVPVSILVVLALLMLAFALAFAAGAPWDRRSSVVPIATASPDPATLVARPTLLPPTDGKGDEWAAGEERVGPISWTTVPSGSAAQPGEGSMSTDAITNDPRTTGPGTWTVTFTQFDITGPAWGSYRMTGADGTWEGTCSGSLTADGAGTRSCWLTGSGAYLGSSYFLQARWPASATGTVEGVIVPAPPPAP